MGLTKKLSTLINATLRGGFSLPHRRTVSSDDPQAQLLMIQQALREVELREREVAEQLKTIRTKLNVAIDQGDKETATAQRRLAHELEARLKTQSTEAVRLAETLAALEAYIAAEKTATDRASRTPQARDEQAQVASTLTSEIDAQMLDEVATNTVSSEIPPGDDDLAARKSRLSD